MSEGTTQLVRERVDAIYRSDSRRVLATLIRFLGDFDLAEEALQDAFTAAVERWPRAGVPGNPRAWLVSTGRFKAIDRLRRRARFDASLAELADRVEADTGDAATDWDRIVGLYDALARIDPSPVVDLNRAVAVAMRDGPETGLALIDELLARGDLADYHLAHSARAELCRRLGRTAEARVSYERALDLTQQEPERRFLKRQLDELRG